MLHRFLGLAFVVSLLTTNSTWAVTSSLVLDKPVITMSAILMDDEITPDQVAKAPSRAAPAQSEEKAEPAKAAAKAPSFFDRVGGFLKQSGAPDLGTKVKQIFNGYSDLTVQADKDYKAKQQARIDSGEQHGAVVTTLLKGWDITTTAVIPSLTYSMESWGLPLIKAIAAIPFAKA
jgi:hypothetical protein